MRFPYIVKEDLSDAEIRTWKDVYLDSSSDDWDRTSEESIWRRTQGAESNGKDGSFKIENKRKRMLHYNYKYDVIFDSRSKKQCLCLDSFYLWIFYTLPVEMGFFEEDIFFDTITQAGWRVMNKNKNNYFYKKEDLVLHIEKNKSSCGKYHDYEFNFSSSNFICSKEITEKPWNILKTGIRNKGKRSLECITFDNKFLEDYNVPQNSDNHTCCIC